MMPYPRLSFCNIDCDGSQWNNSRGTPLPPTTAACPMVFNEARPDIDRHARRRGSASALTAATAATIICRKDRCCPSVFLPQGPETVHTPMKMQGVNYAHVKFSFRVGSLIFCGPVRSDDVCRSGVPCSLALLFHRALLRSALLTQRSTDQMRYRSRCYDGNRSRVHLVSR